MKINLNMDAKEILIPQSKGEGFRPGNERRSGRGRTVHRIDMVFANSSGDSPRGQPQPAWDRTGSFQRSQFSEIFVRVGAVYETQPCRDCIQS